MSRYRFSPTAKQDLKEINRDLIRFSVPAAKRLKEKIRQVCERLAKFPEMGKCADELQFGLRSFPVEDYLIFYRPMSKRIEIVRVLSGYRDLEAIFSEEE